LAADEAAWLLAHARHMVEVVPDFRRGVYRLTAREHVGWFDTPTRRFAIAPKIPWPNVRMLLGLPESQHAAGDAAEPDIGLPDVLAREFAAQLREVTRVGLVAGYSERDAAGTFLRGKLRVADQLRDVAARAFPDRFHMTESVLDLDTPWNRIPRTTADALLASPGLSAATRAEVRDAAVPLESLPATPLALVDFPAAEAEARAAHYRPLLALCRVIHDGFAAANVAETGSGGYLLDLSRAFERFVAAELAAALAPRPAWSVEIQPAFAVGPTSLQPDILIRRRGEARTVLDTKWKAPGKAPDAADLHQILAYATLTGSNHVGLVYPGSRSGRRTFALAGGVRVSLFRVRVVGTTEECLRSVAALASRCCR
jgi:5-methylcytosine-specific restriction enzyme subunit McrC